MTEKELDQQAEEWGRIHDEMGCKGCKFSDPAAMDPNPPRPCCTYPGKIGQEASGRCTKKRGPARGC